MHYRLLLGLLLLPFLTHPTENLDSQTASAKTNKSTVLQPLGSKSKILPSTFRPYKLKKQITSSTAEFKIRLQAEQTPYKASLIGVNINTWLENPEILKTLEKIGQNFPMGDLLNNLQSYNPELEFNDPETVQQVINTDIYTPYFQIFETNIKTPMLFSQIKKVVTYEHPYRIYGVTAGNLPYFGRPMEGGKKEINLGILKGQLSETIAKFPETDIFLIAMINIIPNWLNETSDILQINQQELEILIFAFDRKEKLIGGSGISENFIYQNQLFAIEQKVRSKIWQPTKAKEFYILPSTKIINSVSSGTQTTRDIDLPENQNPRLNNLQRYVLSAIKQRQHENLPLEVELFGSKKEKLLPIKRLPKQKYARLANKILVHRDSKLLVKQNIPNSFDFLSYQETLVRLEDKSENTKSSENSESKSSKRTKIKSNESSESSESKSSKRTKIKNSESSESKSSKRTKIKSNESSESKNGKRTKIKNTKSSESNSSTEKSKPIKMYLPTNEEEKLISLTSDSIKSLTLAPITYSNQPSFTNILVPFELETDPIIYRKERKQYFSLPKSVRQKKKEFNKDTKKLILTTKRQQKEKLFWNSRLQEALKEITLLSPEISNAFNEWSVIYNNKNLLEIKQLKLMRCDAFVEEIKKDFNIFANRNRRELTNRYSSKPQVLSNKISQFELKEQDLLTQIESQVKTEQFITEKQIISEEYKALSEKEKNAYIEFSQLLPKTIDYIKILNKDSVVAYDTGQIKEKYKEFIKETIKKQNISEELAIITLAQKKYSPEYRYQKREKYKKERLAWKNSRFLYFEGFMLGLTSNWKTKSRLSDRMTYL